MSDKLWYKKKFTLCGFNQKEIELIKERYIQNHGGTIINAENDINNNDVDYLICNYSLGYRQRPSSIEYQKLRTPFWLWLSVKDEWNYSLDWHPFFRPNGKFKCNLLCNYYLYLLGYNLTYYGLKNIKSPKYIREMNDIGILVSFITTQMGASINIDDFYNKDEENLNKTKLLLVCDLNINKENDFYIKEETINKIKIKKQEGYQIINVNWLFDCYEEGRVLNYKNYILNIEKYETNFLNLKDNLLKNEFDYTYKTIISHQTYFKYKNDSVNIVNKFINNMIIGRPSKEIIRIIQENEDNIDTIILIVIFSDFIEEQDFWYDLLNSLSENIALNIKLFSEEKKKKIQEFIQRMRILNEPEEFFSFIQINSKIDNFGSKVGYSIPSFINEIFESNKEILDTVLQFTDFQNVTNLNSFVEYANDESLDIIEYNKVKAVKKFNNIENDFFSEKLS